MDNNFLIKQTKDRCEDPFKELNHPRIIRIEYELQFYLKL